MTMNLWSEYISDVIEDSHNSIVVSVHAVQRRICMRTLGVDQPTVTRSDKSHMIVPCLN